jgi:hypothetical protein
MDGRDLLTVSSKYAVLAQFEGVPTRTSVELFLMSRFYMFHVVVRTPWLT